MGRHELHEGVEVPVRIVEGPRRLRTGRQVLRPDVTRRDHPCPRPQEPGLEVRGEQRFGQQVLPCHDGQPDGAVLGQEAPQAARVVLHHRVIRSGKWLQAALKMGGEEPTQPRRHQGLPHPQRPGDAEDVAVHPEAGAKHGQATQRPDVGLQQDGEADAGRRGHARSLEEGVRPAPRTPGAVLPQVSQHGRQRAQGHPARVPVLGATVASLVLTAEVGYEDEVQVGIVRDQVVYVPDEHAQGEAVVGTAQCRGRRVDLRRRPGADDDGGTRLPQKPLKDAGGPVVVGEGPRNADPWHPGHRPCPPGG